MARQRLTRRMRVLKWLLSIAAVVVILVGAASYWWIVDATYVYPGAGSLWVAVGVGDFGASCELSPTSTSARATLRWNVETSTVNNSPHLHWVYWYTGASTKGAEYTLFVPLWLIAVVLAVPAAGLWYRDRRRYAPWACARCGYDRRGLNPPDACCPECGSTAAQLDSVSTT